MLQSRLICLLGLFTFVAIAWCFSTNRRKFPWRVVAGGLALQLALAALILRTIPGQMFFAVVGDAFTAVMGSVSAGSGFVFETEASQGEDFNLLRTFAFGVLPTVIFFHH